MKSKEKKQSSIDFLKTSMILNENNPSYHKWVFDKAKKTFREEISEAWEAGYQDGIDEGQWSNARQYLCGEHYHDETFGQNEK